MRQLNKHYGTSILISESTHALVENEFLTRKIDLVAVKGRAEGLFIYELIAKKSQADTNQTRFVARYHHGIDCYLKKSWEEAMDAFRDAQSILTPKEDKPSSIMAERCRKYQLNPPSEEWNGVYRYEEK